MKTALERAVEAAGSQNELARRIGVRQSTLWSWLRRNESPVPAEYAIPIELAVDAVVTRDELRPDLFGTQSGKAA